MTLRPPGKEFECDIFISDLLRTAYTSSIKRPIIEIPLQYSRVRPLVLILIML